MKRLSPTQHKWVKGFHVFFACLWVGGATALTLMLFSMKANDGMELYGIHLSMKFVDDFIIIPGVIGSLLTGILFSAYTNWGWFKHKWVIVKWAINLFGLIFGMFFLGPWVNSLPPIAREKGMEALVDPLFSRHVMYLMIFGTFQASTVVIAIWISTLKPWKKKSTTK